MRMRIMVSRKTGQYYELYVMRKRAAINRLLSVCRRKQAAYNRCFTSGVCWDVVVMGGEPVNAVEQFVELCDYYERLMQQDLICAEIAHLVASLNDIHKIRYFALLLRGELPASHFSGKLLRRVRGWFIQEMRNILHGSNCRNCMRGEKCHEKCQESATD